MIKENIYYVSLQAFGDNLVSISLLSQLDGKVNIIGTKITENIINLVGLNDKFNIKVVSEDIPAFYHIRKYGVINAIKDVFSFRRNIKNSNIKVLIFEKKDFRISLLTAGLNVKVYSSNNYNYVYNNRVDLIRNTYEKDVKLDYNINIKKEVRTVLINPVTRSERRDITKDNLYQVLSILKSHRIKVKLVDYSKEYSEFEGEVDQYFTNTTLEEVRDLLLSCDLYLGGDSFLVHLAYYYHKPYFIIFNYEYNRTFLPPFSQVNDNYIVISDSQEFKSQFEGKFLSFIKRLI